jgi:hypothetical protein
MQTGTKSDKRPALQCHESSDPATCASDPAWWRELGRLPAASDMLGSVVEAHAEPEHSIKQSNCQVLKYVLRLGDGNIIRVALKHVNLNHNTYEFLVPWSSLATLAIMLQPEGV